jgi:hypothetical protein
MIYHYTLVTDTLTYPFQGLQLRDSSRLSLDSSVIKVLQRYKYFWIQQNKNKKKLYQKILCISNKT